MTEIAMTTARGADPRGDAGRPGQSADMTRPADPILAFGLRAQAVAVKAQASSLSEREMLGLVEALLDWAGEDVRARDAVREFLALCRHDVPAAGRYLQEWLEGWICVISDNWPGDVLAGLEGEAPGPLPAGWRHVAACLPPVGGAGHG